MNARTNNNKSVIIYYAHLYVNFFKLAALYLFTLIYSKLLRHNNPLINIETYHFTLIVEKYNNYILGVNARTNNNKSVII